MNKVINPLQFKQQVMELLYQPAPSSPDLTQLLPELKRAIRRRSTYPYLWQSNSRCRHTWYE